MDSNVSPITQQPMYTNTLETNHEAKTRTDNFRFKSHLQQMTQYQFRLDVDIKKTRQKPLFQAFGKSIYEAEWINQDGPPIILLKIDGAKAERDASFYVKLSCHPHIVHTYGLVQCNPGSIMLLQEYAPKGDLSDLLRENEFQPSERALWKIFIQICDAMIFLADNGIVHGDLACRNVLVFEMDSTNLKKNLVKLTDFGLTRGSKLYSLVDSPALTTMTIIATRYAAPEVLQNPNKLSYSEKSDVYSMGVLMWEASSNGELPYSSIEKDKDIRQLKLKDKRLPKPSPCSDPLWIIMNKCWNLKPFDRPNFQFLKESLTNLQSKSILKSESEIKQDASMSLAVTRSPMVKADHPRDERREYSSKEDSDTGISRTVAQNESTSCPFCQEYLSSSVDAYDHLLKCGNKTDQCPNCRLYIRRAIFAYHYENNCANIDEANISNRFNNSSSDSNRTTRSAASNTRNLTNINSKRQQRSIVTSNQKSHTSSESVLIPCEYCQEQCPTGEFHLHEATCSRNPTVMVSTKRSTQERSPSSKSDDDTTPLVPNAYSARHGRSFCLCC